MTQRDKHGQPDAGFRRTANIEKMINTLLGICQGITADTTLNSDEITYLSVWLNDADPLVYGDPDAFDIVCQVKDILADGYVSRDELDDLRDMLNDIVEQRSLSRFSSEETILHRLGGMAHGLTADGRLNDSEVLALSTWLESNAHMTNTWPFSRIIQRVRSVLEDGHISESERHELLVILKDLNGSALEEHGTVGGMSTKLYGLDMPDDVELIFPDRAFVLTGKFAYGPRDRCSKEIIDRGGLVGSAITKKVDYLVVGSLSSRDWINESYGLKIRKAVELREQGHSIVVLDEEVWACAIGH